MVRIMFNYNCNLACTYCFEKHFWNKRDKLTTDELRTILKFAGPREETTICGGEPTQHPYFKELCSVLREYPNKHFLLTNALFHPDLRQDIADTFRLILVNIMDPRSYTEENWTTVQDNILALADKGSDCLVQLGINLYDKNQRFEYLIPFFKHVDIIKEIRVSLAKPNYCFTNKSLDLREMKDIAPMLLNLVSMAALYNFEVSFDCPIPPCLFSTQQMQMLSQYTSDLRFGDCAGVFTIYPGLKVGHCFGSYPEMYDLEEFDSVKAIQKRIFEKEEELMYDISSFKECYDCFFRKNRTCQGGCLAFKVRKILEREMGNGK